MKIGRNDPCPCGSGKKYKYCCYAKDHERSVPEPVQEAASEPDDSAETEERPTKSRHSHDHEHGRSKFHGSSRNKGATISPCANRGAQRGS